MMKHLIITPGDPTGIGPEITIKALTHLMGRNDLKLTLVGSLKALEREAHFQNRSLSDFSFMNCHDVSDNYPGSISYKSIEKAVELIHQGKADALVTGPISKANLAAAQYSYAGHTEILEHLTKVLWNTMDSRAEMLFLYKRFRLLLLTRHIPLRDVSSALAKPGAVARPLKTLISFLRHNLGIAEPHIAMLGLNPHAGELSGEEEKQYFLPVIHAVNAIGATTLKGPFAADAFFRSYHPEQSPFDAVVAPTHDQGLIPFKMIAGYAAVNVTLGLPFIRTSVSHGTADDIVGRGMALEDSLLAAIELAEHLTGVLPHGRSVVSSP